MGNIWKYIKADPFFKDFLPHIKSHKYKIRGSNSRGGPTGFTPKEIREINRALKKIPQAKHVAKAKEKIQPMFDCNFD